MDQVKKNSIIYKGQNSTTHEVMHDFLSKIEKVTVDGTIYYVVKDIARELGYQVSSHSSLIPSEGDKKILPVERGAGERNTTCVSGNELIKLIINSRVTSPTVIDLKNWIISRATDAIRDCSLGTR